MEFTNLEDVLTQYAKYVVQQAKSNLSKTRPYPKNKGQLYNTLDYKILDNNEAILVEFLMEDYWEFVDQGVKGKNPNGLPQGAKYYGKQKAPNSPFKFGTGTGKKGGLRAAINKWTVKKGLKGVRDPKTGRFLPRKSMQYLIVRNIYLSGIKPTLFFSKPFIAGEKKYELQLKEAFVTDLQNTIIGFAEK
tara:strand:+ start:1884 stop:2453 length:570 start_codon:yes stop_codon:yes gene_type:complete